MHSIVELKYKILYDKSAELLQFFKNYIMDDYVNKYRYLTEKNIGIEEKSVLYRKDVNYYIPNLSLKRYINNGFLLNSSDRVICLRNNSECLHAYFLYTPDTNDIKSTKIINIYFINSDIKDLKDDNEILYNKTVLSTACYLVDNIISGLNDFPSLYNLPFNLFETRIDNIISVGKIQNFIATMMVLDKHFNLKFSDWETILDTYRYENDAADLMHRAYCYAIEENKTDEDYEEILKCFYHL